MPSWEATARSPDVVEQPGERRPAPVSGSPGELDRPIAGRGDGLEGPGQVLGHESADGVELERDLVVSHPRTIGHPN